jgi:hypothetical protein
VAGISPARRALQGRPGTLAGLARILKVLHEDLRYRRLRNLAARALDHALISYADADGRWQRKVEVWAGDIGTSASSLHKALTELVECSLLSRTTYLRPAAGGQGANIYALDPALVTRAGENARPRESETRSSERDRAARAGEDATPARTRGGARPVRVSERVLERSPQPPEGGRRLSRKELRRYTGCQLVRGSHGRQHVPDVLGKDKPPPDWKHEKPTEAEIVAALDRRQDSQTSAPESCRECGCGGGHHAATCASASEES